MILTIGLVLEEKTLHFITVLLCCKHRNNYSTKKYLKIWTSWFCNHVKNAGRNVYVEVLVIKILIRLLLRSWFYYLPTVMCQIITSKLDMPYLYGHKRQSFYLAKLPQIYRICFKSLYTEWTLPPYILDKSICNFRMSGWVINRNLNLKNGWMFCKQWRPWSDAASRSVWSGSALFAKEPVLGYPSYERVIRFLPIRTTQKSWYHLLPGITRKSPFYQLWVINTLNASKENSWICK